MLAQPDSLIGGCGERARGDEVGHQVAAPNSQVLQHLELENLVKPAVEGNPLGSKRGPAHRVLEGRRLEKRHVDFRDHVRPAKHLAGKWSSVASREEE